MTSTWDIRPAIAPEREAGTSWLMLVVLLAGQFMALLDCNYPCVNTEG